jgi:hypothetical protein
VAREPPPERVRVPRAPRGQVTGSTGQQSGGQAGFTRRQLGKRVRLADKCPTSAGRRAPVALWCSQVFTARVLSWLPIPAPGCHVLIADITRESQLPLIRR